MNEQLQKLSEDAIKEMVKGKESEFAFTWTEHQDTFRHGVDKWKQLALAHRVDGCYQLVCHLLPDEITKWEKELNVHGTCRT